jgi:SAM-dependent methyltransferase
MTHESVDEAGDRRRQRQAVWARHWASGAAHSCAGSYDETYGGAIAQFWRGVAAGFAPGTRVLDIATGSGALPRLLRALQPGIPWQVDAVDLAPVQPAWWQALPSEQRALTRFHGAAAAESLPFAEGQFDTVVSQYGLEYADLPRAVSELLRVRAPRGHVALVLHHSASRPVTLATVEMAHIAWLRAAEGLLPAAQAMLEPMARAATAAGRASLAADPEAAARRQRFNQVQQVLESRLAVPDGADVLQETRAAVHGLFGLAQQQGAAVADAAWSSLDAALADAHWRLDELRRCALAPAAIEHLQTLLRPALPHSTVQVLQEGPYTMGWALTARP